jgi:hypothetical protein
MNIESIVILGVCIVAIAAVSYYFYNRCQSQQSTIDSLLKKCDELEHRLKPVPLHSELAAVYQRNRQQPRSQQNQESFNPSEPCGNSLCDLQPIVVPTTEHTIEDIAAEELNIVLEKK